MWSVAYTDIFQLSIVAIGLCVALPFVLSGAGGLHHVWDTYVAARPEGAGIVPPWRPQTTLWTHASVIGWWDTSLMLMLGGIPWNCYFQRVLPVDRRAGSRFSQAR
jgi:high affinity choline transporter 7